MDADGEPETRKFVRPPFVNIAPCTPSANMQEPGFPVHSYSTESTSNGKSQEVTGDVKDVKVKHSPFQARRFFRHEKKSSSTSFQTSLEYTDDESVATRESGQDNLSNGSLSDSMNQSAFYEKKNIEEKKRKKKRNRISQIISGVSHKSKAELFQKLFKDMSGDERLITDYSCALYRDILVHGRLYLSQNWLCFYANIFGWETLVTVPWTEVTAITKEKTAKVIPNAIQILTGTDKYFFTTFVTRENSYTALFRIWQNALMNHPMEPVELRSVVKKYRQKNRSFADSTVDGDPINDEHDETGDEIVENEDTKSILSTSESQEQLDRLVPGENENPSEPLETHADHTPNHSANNDPEDKQESGRTMSNSSQKTRKSTSEPPGSQEKMDASKNVTKNENHVKEEHKEETKYKFHRPISPFKQAHDLFRKKRKKKVPQRKHPSYHLSIPNREGGETTTDFETDESGDEATHDEDHDYDAHCPCDSHFGKEYLNEEFNFDVDALYEHLFSQESDIMKRVFEQRKFSACKYTTYEKQPDGSCSQTLSYTLPLNYSIGPKSSDTVSKQIMHADNKAGDFYVVDAENTSHGVPYSDSFYVAVRYCITRLIGNRSRLRIHAELRYTKRVFGLVKNMISKSADEACRDYFNFLVTVLKSESELVPVNPKRRKNVPTDSKKLEPPKTSDSGKSPPTGGTEVKVVSTAESSGFLSNFQMSTTSIVVIILVVLFLISMNMYLMLRLRNLENSVLIRKNNWIPKTMPASDDEWSNLLHYQKGLHDLELSKLKEVIGSTASLIKHVEVSISSLHEELEKSPEENKLPDYSKRNDRAELKDGL